MNGNGADTDRGGPIALPAELMVWLSSSFPVGAFAYSHGLETAAHHRLVRDRDSLRSWLATLVAHGSLRTDLIVLAEAWRARRDGDADRLAAVNELALALQPSAERHLETTTQGWAFRATIRAAWDDPMSLDDTATSPGTTPRDGAIAYPVAVGMAAAGHDLALGPVLLGYGIAFVTNLASAAIRLSLVGQTDAQRVVAALMPALDIAARQASEMPLDELGSAAFAADLASLAHETQETRLFRS